MRILTALPALALMALMPALATAQSATETSWPSLGFAAAFGGPTTLDTSNAGDGDEHPMITITHSAGEMAQTVIVATIPELTDEVLADSATREFVLDNAQENSLAQSGGTLKSQRSLMLSGRHGREFISIATQAGAVVRTRAYLERSRLYVLVVVVSGDDGADEGLQFLNSFRFL